MNKNLINEPPLLVLPTLAKLIGLNEAIILQQIHYWISNPKIGKVYNEKRWVRNTVKEWKNDNFPFWGLNTIRRAVKNLEDSGVILSTSELNKAPYDNSKWYTIDYIKLSQLDNNPLPKMGKGTTQNGQSELPKMGKPIPETTTETTTDIWATPKNPEPTTEKQGAVKSSLDDYFPRPKQSPDNGTPRKRQTADDMLSWGRADELELQQAEEDFLEFGWTINSPAIRQTAAVFFKATPFQPPGDDSTRGYWLKTFRKHSQNWSPKRCLELYEAAYKHLRQATDRSGNPLNISSPDSLTETMRSIDLREQTEQDDGPLPVGSTEW